MKKSLLFILLFCLPYVYGQQESDQITKVEIVKDSSLEAVSPLGTHELRLNALSLLTVADLNIFYERIIDESSSYGISTFISLGEPDPVLRRAFALNPYYRFYFLNREDYGTKGFFIEPFASFASVDGNNSSNSFEVSIGMSLGKKWINRNGFSFETYIGIGRYLTDSPTPENFHVPIGIAIGKRF